MHRREFITLLGGAASSLAVAGRALIGFLSAPEAIAIYKIRGLML